jgi:transposase
MTDLRYCKACFEKQQTINRLTEENERLKAQLRAQTRSAKESPFGSGTPSAKRPFKPNALSERQARRGGAKPGHVGHGRRALGAAEADRLETLAVEISACTECGAGLRSEGHRQRTVIDLKPPKVEKVLYRLERRVCARCGRRYRAAVPGVLPKCLYSNAFLTHVATQHYLWGVPLGRIEQQTGVGYGSLIRGQKQLARLLKPATHALIEAYRRSEVKHADESGWRTDGQNGYAWLFATSGLSLFRFRKSRSAVVAAEVLGKKPLPGVLVVDRYSAYNRAPVPIQYCLEHLKRDVADLDKQFPDQNEVAAFVASLVPALREAMTLRTLGLSRKEFLRRAGRTRRRIIAIVHRQAKHPAIQRMQNVFRKHKDRLYHWARDPSIPAENNLAERDLRPLVIARKVSFGSQSEAGAHTRETLMTLLHTLKKRRGASGVAPALQFALDRLAASPDLDPTALLFETPPPASDRD